MLIWHKINEVCLVVFGVPYFLVVSFAVCVWRTKASRTLYDVLHNFIAGILMNGKGYERNPS